MKIALHTPPSIIARPVTLFSARVDHVVTAWSANKQLRLVIMHGRRERVTGVMYSTPLSTRHAHHAFNA